VGPGGSRDAVRDILRDDSSPRANDAAQLCRGGEGEAGQRGHGSSGSSSMFDD
jgi:hypothetical protein